MMKLFQIINNMPGCEIKNLSLEDFKTFLISGKKLIIIKRVESEIQIQYCVNVKEDVFLIHKLTDSYNDIIVLTLIEAMPFNKTTLQIQMKLLQKSDFLLFDSHDYLRDSSVFIPKIHRNPHSYTSLSDVINDVKGTKNILFFNDPTNPVFPI